MSIAFWLSLIGAYAFIAYCVIGIFGIVHACQSGDLDAEWMQEQADNGRMFLYAVLWPLAAIRTLPTWYDAPVYAIVRYVQARRKRKAYRTPYQRI